MELKCLDQLTCSLILASLTLIACIIRFEFLVSVLQDTTQPKSDVDWNINILLYINLVIYGILGLMSVLLIYALVKKRHQLMIPWFLAALVSISCEILFVIYILAKGHSKDVLFILIGTALSIWIIWMIFSLYKTMREDNRSEHLDNMQNYRYSSTRVIEIY